MTTLDTKEQWFLQVAFLLGHLHIPPALADEAERLYKIGTFPGSAAKLLRRFATHQRVELSSA